MDSRSASIPSAVILGPQPRPVASRTELLLTAPIFSYLAIVGPAYAFYGLGMALYFATQGLGHVLPAVAANAARFLLSAGASLAAIFWLDAGPTGFFVAIAGGFLLYGVLTVCALLAVKPPAASFQRPGSRSTQPRT